ncbi:MAG: aldehyde dehydrogenase [Caldilineaceae bacterium]|nr:aldehyde dehydrogenase [Caldilineaceae bacterium]
MKQVLHVIDGKEEPSLSGRTFDSINPATGQPWATVAFGEVEDVERAVTSAWRAFDAGVWSAMPPAERARRMRAVAHLIADRADAIAELESKDNGKPLSAAKGDVLGAATLLEYFSQLPEQLAGTMYASDPGYFTYSKREPYGVVGAIAPWNFPFSLAVWKTAAPLAVGNSVVIKMAEQTPVTTTEFARLCLEGGIPPGVVNVVHGDGRTTGATLAAHPRVPKITFTGSTEVGRSIMRSSAEQIKSVHLELGGKSANIIFADADLEQALQGTLFTSFFNSGQICTTGSRLLIAAEIADEFLARFQERAKQLVVGDPFQAATQLGPLISASQLERVQHYVEVGKAAGAQVLLGGDSPRLPGLEQGYFINPTVFCDVKPEMRIAQEEIFGPVLSVMTFQSDEEAIRIANSTIYGLATTLWTTNLARALTMAEKLDAGIIWTNCPHYIKWNVPYEGHRTSGLGEDLGVESLKTFTKLKVNYINYGGHSIQWA